MTPPTRPTTDRAESRYQLRCDRLPLAIYREVAAHLRQVSGVRVQLLEQRSQQFDYRQSQVGGLELEYDTDVNPISRQQVDGILAYYGDRYGAWDVMSCQ